MKHAGCTLYLVFQSHQIHLSDLDSDSPDVLTLRDFLAILEILALADWPLQIYGVYAAGLGGDFEQCVRYLYTLHGLGDRPKSSRLEVWLN